MGDFGLFKTVGHHDNTTIKPRKYFISDTLEIDWPKVKILVNENELKLPHRITIPIIHKYKIRRIMSKPTFRLHMVTQKGNSWYSFLPEEQKQLHDKHEVTVK